MKPEKKNKKCSHSKVIWDNSLGYSRCQLCGKKIGRMGDMIKTDGIKTEALRIVHTDPRLEQAEKLKLQYTSLMIKIKKNWGTAEDRKVWQFKADELKKQMLALERSYDE